MVGKRHIKPSVFVKLKMMNQGIPTASLKELYWNNPDAQRGLESNFKNWQAYYRGQKLKKQKKEGTTSKQTNLPKHKKKRILTKRGTNQPKKKKDARTQTRMEKGTKSRNKSRKGLQAVKAQASLEPPKLKSSEMLDCQGLLCPEQSTSTWPEPTFSGHVDVPLDFTDFHNHDPFGWTSNVGEIEMSEFKPSEYEPKSEPKYELEYVEYEPKYEPISPYSSEDVAHDMLKQSLDEAEIGVDSGVELAPISVTVKPFAKVGPMIIEPNIAEPVVVGPAQIADVGVDVVADPVMEIADLGVDAIADPVMEIVPDVGADVGVDAIAELAMDIEPAQIGEVGVGPEMVAEPVVVAEPAMVAEPVAVVGPAAVYNVGDDPEIILMDQGQGPVDLGDSDIEILGEFENSKQQQLKRRLHYRQTLTRQRQGGYHGPKYRHQRKGRRY